MQIRAGRMSPPAPAHVTAGSGPMTLSRQRSRRSRLLAQGGLA